MLSWRFLQKPDGSGVNPDLQAKFQTQFVSDVYKTMQARLDGYRQSAAAVFLSVVAAMLTIDAATVSSVVRSLLEQTKDHIVDHHRIGVFALGMGFFILGLGLVGAWVIRRLGKYFAEMTSIVYRIEQNSKVFEPDEYLPGKALYPRNFKNCKNVSIDGEQDLPGWPDPSIQHFFILACGLACLHLLFGYIVYRLLC